MAEWEHVIEEEDVEIVDGLPVLVEIREEVQPPPSPPDRLPVRQTAVVAAGGFVAGAATAVIFSRHIVRALARQRGAASPVRRRASPDGSELLDVVSVRSFLIDVHLLGRRDER